MKGTTHRMESVEELCDSVALINKSRKILDGKVFEVREKFKQNLFNVVLSDVNFENLETLKNQYQLINIHDQHGLISFDLNYNEDQNLLLNDLMKAGKIRSFDEKIPSMNEVFITAVSSPQSAISSL